MSFKEQIRKHSYDFGHGLASEHAMYEHGADKAAEILIAEAERYCNETVGSYLLLDHLKKFIASNSGSVK